MVVEFRVHPANKHLKRGNPMPDIYLSPFPVFCISAISYISAPTSCSEYLNGIARFAFIY